MAGTVTTGNIPRLLQEGLNSVFGNAYDEHQEEFPQFYELKDSMKAFEVDAQLEGMGLAPEKAEGDEIAMDSFRQGFTPKYKHLTFAKGFIITKEALADELYGEMKKRAGALAFSMRQTKEVVAANVINRAFNNSFTMVDGDGVSLINLAHVNGPSGGTFSNRITVNADLSEQSLEDLLIQIGEIRDPRGLRIALQGISLNIPVALQFEAQRILGSVLQNDTVNNATNALRDMKSIREGFMVNHYLTDPKAWFIRTNARDGLTCFKRQNVEFGQDNAFTSGNARFKADERYSFGWSDPRTIFGSEGT